LTIGELRTIDPATLAAACTDIEAEPVEPRP
jgi:hypothetical protein